MGALCLQQTPVTAKSLRVTQPCISDLTRGRIHLFSVDAAVDFLAPAGLPVTLRVGRAA
jgi:predicted XRE-type DNA-binding protein